MSKTYQAIDHNIPSTKKSNAKTGNAKIISDVTKYDSSVKTPSIQEFRNNAKNGRDIEKSTSIKLGSLELKLNEEFFLSNGLSTNDYKLKAEEMYLTAEFFGLNFLENDLGHVLFELSHELYAYNPTPDLDNDDNTAYFDIYPKYDEWKRYCIFVDNTIEYIKINFPKHSKDQESTRQMLKTNSELFPSTIIEDIYEFLLEFDLNQHKSAKIKKLLSVGLPNITEENAEKIVTLYLQNKIENL